MNPYLADTTVLVDHLRNDARATAFLDEEEVIITGVTVAELIQGARNTSELKAVGKLVDQFETHWGSETIIEKSVVLLSQYFLSHNLRFMDALIAATALETSLMLVTANTKHFSFIPHLRVLTMDEISPHVKVESRYPPVQHNDKGKTGKGNRPGKFLTPENSDEFPV